MPGLTRLQKTHKFSEPDTLGSPSHELDRITKGLYQKIGGSRAIGLHLNPLNTRSPSFTALVTGIRKLIDTIGAAPQTGLRPPAALTDQSEDEDHRGGPQPDLPWSV